MSTPTNLLTLRILAVLALSVAASGLGFECSTEPGVNYKGNNLNKGRAQATSSVQCADRCIQRVSCEAFTFKNGECFMKSSAAGRKAQKGAVSGTCARRPPPAPTPPVAAPPVKPPAPAAAEPGTSNGNDEKGHPCKTEEKVDFSGNDLHQGRAQAGSIADCADRCNKRGGCKAFTFLSSWCYLKSSADGRKAHAGAVSGVCGQLAQPAPVPKPPVTTPTPKPNPPPPVQPNPPSNGDSSSPQWHRDVSLDCRFEPGTQFQGQTISTHRDGTAYVCAARCLKEQQCKAFSWSAGSCYLKSAAGQRKTGSSSYTSGSCVPETCKGEYCNKVGGNWQDSYSVGGRCYCSFGGHAFDHDIGEVQVPVPDVGQRSVREVCSMIRDTFGEGPKNGRKYYNTVACGHAPFNNAGDEDHDACPGRVDMGAKGCQIYGPFWDLAGAFDQQPQPLTAGGAGVNDDRAPQPSGGASSGTVLSTSVNTLKERAVVVFGAILVVVAVVVLAVSAVKFGRRQTAPAAAAAKTTCEGGHAHTMTRQSCSSVYSVGDYEEASSFAGQFVTSPTCTNGSVYWQFPMVAAITEDSFVLPGLVETGGVPDRHILRKASTDIDNDLHSVISV